MAGKTMIPLLAFAAWSGTGKTTLLKKLIPALCARGIRPGLIKHTHHDMDVDKPGKDSYELRKAGAAQTIVASQQRWALMTETPDEEELDLQQVVADCKPDFFWVGLSTPKQEKFMAEHDPRSLDLVKMAR
ncbi:MAG: molybdopterin-guanine dinucleotide biosynthesis protein B, partial [Escherichia coli]